MTRWIACLIILFLSVSATYSQLLLSTTYQTEIRSVLSQYDTSVFRINVMEFEGKITHFDVVDTVNKNEASLSVLRQLEGSTNCLEYIVQSSDGGTYYSALCENLETGKIDFVFGAVEVQNGNALIPSSYDQCLVYYKLRELDWIRFD